MHFYLAALLTLDDDQLNRIYDCMREHGATIEEATVRIQSSSVTTE
jgi:hypothetical protein